MGIHDRHAGDIEDGDACVALGDAVQQCVEHLLRAP